MAPPLTFSFSMSNPSSRTIANDCEANASFNSIRSISESERPVSLSTLGMATIGPMPITSGRTPATAKPTKRSKGFSPSCSARSRSITTTAAAPSLRWEEFPAVIVPPAWKAGRNVVGGVGLSRWGVGEEMGSRRGAGQGLGPPRHDRSGEARHDALRRRGNRLQARGAKAIDGLSRHTHRQTCPRRRLPGDVESLRPFRNGTADDHVFYLCRVQSWRTPQHFFDGRTCHVDGIGGPQRSTRCSAHSGASTGDNNGFFHVVHLPSF